MCNTSGKSELVSIISFISSRSFIIGALNYPDSNLRTIVVLSRIAESRLIYDPIKNSILLKLRA